MVSKLSALILVDCEKKPIPYSEWELNIKMDVVPDLRGRKPFHDPNVFINVFVNYLYRITFLSI